MKTITIEDILKHEPCKEGVDFLSQFKTLQEAWLACEDSQHFFWALRKLKLIPKATSVKLARIFAERAKKFAENADADYWTTRAAEYAADADAAEDAAYWAAEAAAYASRAVVAYKKEKAEQCRIIREHVNPFKD
jgi:hypothetical protein